MLKSTGLQAWILDESANRRENLITANAEGLTSLMGYLTIFYASLAIGEFMAKTRWFEFPPKRKNSNFQKKKNFFFSIRIKSWIRRCFQLFALSLILFFIQIAAEKCVDPPCRRVVNATYIFSQVDQFVNSSRARKNGVSLRAIFGVDSHFFAEKSEKIKKNVRWPSFSLSRPREKKKHF